MATIQNARVAALSVLVLALGLVSRGQQLPAPHTEAAPQPVEPAAESIVKPRAELPITPPKVTCVGENVTISANNSTLASILAEIKKCMGTKIDVPDAAASTRFFDQIGPGPAHEVLEDLLSATGYNYIIESANNTPNKIETIMLMARSADTAPALVDDRNLSLNRKAFQVMRQATATHPVDLDSLTATTESDKPAADPAAAAPPASSDAAAPATDPAAKPVDATTPAAAPAASPAPGPSTETPPTPQPDAAPVSDAAKHTESQIQGMEQMFEQRKQMIQNANQPPPPQ